MGSRNRPKSCLKGQRRFQTMKKIITFSSILKQRSKATNFFVLSGSFVYLASQPDNGTDDINHLYMNSKGKIGFISSDRSTVPQSVIEKKDAESLSFTTRVWLWGKEGVDYVKNDGYWMMLNEYEFKRVIIRVVADSFAKKGYSHQSVTWALWNNPEANWMCPFAQPINTDNKRKQEIEALVKRMIVKRMCESLMEVFKVSKAVYEYSSGSTEYDLLEMKKIERTRDDDEEFDMNEEDVKDVEKILTDEEKSEYEYILEEMNN